MKYDFKNLTIKTQLLLLFALFVVLAAVNFFALHYFIDRIDTTRQRVEIAEQLPGSINDMSKSAAAISANDELTKKKIQQATSQIDKVLEVFTHGGKLNKEADYLGPLDDDNKKDLKHIKILWDSLLQTVSVLRFDPYTLDTTTQEVIEVPNNDSLNTTHTEVVDKKIKIENPAIAKAKSYVADHTEDLKERVEILTTGLIAAHERAISILDSAILIIVFINLVIISLLLLGIRRVILEPINQLDSITNRLTHGEFEIDANFQWQNEVSAVGKKINKLAVGLKNATDFVKEIGKGELDKEFKGIDTSNVNGLEAALLEMREQMKKVDQEEEIRNWSTGGLAKFVDILRSSNDDVNELSDKIISSLVDYSHSNQGGLYLLNDDDQENKYLELISLYAFNTLKYDKKSYRLGEGLVGQTFLERKTTYLLEIPDEYIEITSGLGGANPKAILIVPLQVNEEIFGILELASFEEYKDYEIEFVEKLGESIASTIASVRNNQRTKRLLQESQELTEQMQAQEEEMRQNMEELSATQEEMARKEIEITAQLTAINNSLGTVEYDINGIITSANTIFEEAMGYNSGELLDKSCASVYEDVNDIWPALKNGTGQSGEFKFLKKNGEAIILESTFTPIKNDEGEVYKIIQLITKFDKKEGVIQDQWKEVEEVEAALKQNLEALDITQQQLDHKLRTAEHKLTIVDEWVKVITTDQQLNIKDVNRSFVQFSGMSLKDIKGQPVTNVFGIELENAIKERHTNTKVLVTDKQGNQIEKQVSLIYQETEDINIFILWV